MLTFVPFQGIGDAVKNVVGIAVVKSIGYNRVLCRVSSRDECSVSGPSLRVGVFVEAIGKRTSLGQEPPKTTGPEGIPTVWVIAAHLIYRNEDNQSRRGAGVQW